VSIVRNYSEKKMSEKSAEALLPPMIQGQVSIDFRNTHLSFRVPADGNDTK
jgi:hypothetical protein